MATKISHGAYESRSPYDVVQHEYAAAGAYAYIEVLEIVDAPGGQPKYIIHWYFVPNSESPGHHCYSFASLEDAINAWQIFYFEQRFHTRDRFNQQIGYLGYEHSLDTPWFYDPN